MTMEEKSNPHTHLHNKKPWSNNDNTIWLATTLGTSVNYSYSPQFGFLTADPSHSGTGLYVHVFLHLPALVHTNQLHAFLHKNMVEGIAVTGLQGDPLNRIGDVVVVHNQYM